MTKMELLKSTLAYSLKDNEIEHAIACNDIPLTSAILKPNWLRYNGSFVSIKIKTQCQAKWQKHIASTGSDVRMDRQGVSMF